MQLRGRRRSHTAGNIMRLNAPSTHGQDCGPHLPSSAGSEGSAPLSSKAWMAARLPAMAAACRGVRPSPLARSARLSLQVCGKHAHQHWVVMATGMRN